MIPKKAAFLFAGQGAQAVGMGQSLCAVSSRANALYEQANAILGWDLRHISFEGPVEKLTETRVCQPALYVHGYALFEEFRARFPDVVPVAVAGLSLGELTALAAAGAVSFETGLRLVEARGRLMQEACDRTHGSMASVIGGTREEVQLFCEKYGVEMANLNCPGQIVISGEKARIQEAVAAGREAGFKLVKELQVAGAYHSSLMQSAREAFAPVVEAADIQLPGCAFYANVSGKRAGDVSAIKQGLIEQVVSAVRFEDDVLAMAADISPDGYVECGPGQVIAGLLKRINREWQCLSFSEAADFDKVSIA